jgi:hypothetical protein
MNIFVPIFTTGPTIARRNIDVLKFVLTRGHVNRFTPTVDPWM